MKILATQDLHQNIKKWDDLTRTAKRLKPDVITIAGDIFPKYDGFPAQLEWIDEFFNYCEKLSKTCKKLFLTLGNDDHTNLIPILEENSGSTYIHLHNRSCEFEGITFCGMPWITDHPFGYKGFCRKEFDNDYGIDERHFTHPGEILSSGHYVRIPDYKAWLDAQPLSIYDQLLNVASPIHKKMATSIWLIHNPPRGCGLSTITSGKDVGSSAVRFFIEEHAPAITLHGHIHESPYYSNNWYANIGKTVAINPGQIELPLHYVMLDIEIIGNRRKKIQINSMRHSVCNNQIRPFG
jgi:Icc-related predicted phosphoesterase